MPTDNTYDRILAYLKGLLSHRQRHDLEREMMHDVFEEEAFEGLSQLSGGDLEKDMELLHRKLDGRIMPAKKNQLTFYFRMAAAIVLLIGVGSILYFVMRTPGANLLSDEHKIEVQPTTDKEKPDQPVANKENTIQPKAGKEKVVQPIREKKAEITPQTVQEPVADLMESAEEVVSRPSAAQENEEVKIPEITAAKDLSKSRTMRKSATAPVNSRKVISGMVVDNNGEALPGVTVMEKGSANGTVSDMNGKFSLALQDTNSRIDLKYIGYKPVELKAHEKIKDKIVMEEDLVALNEVVVVGYGTEKRVNVTGAVSTITLDKDTKQNDQPVLIKPIPPGGSLRSFKKWVNDRLDYTAYKEYPGKHKVTVELTVNANGTISNIRVDQNVPDVIAADLKKVILQSSLWTAALKDGNPLVTDVEIHFVITVE